MSRGVEPLFIKDKDISAKDISPYDICKALETVIRGNAIDGAQKIGGVWRLYFKDRDSRTNVLLKKSLVIVGKEIPLYDQNPFSTKQINPDDKKDKLTIKNIPLSVSNEEIQKMLESKNVKLASPVKYSYIRDETGSLTTYRNGDRFVYCEPFDPPLPVKQKVGDFHCLVFHHGKDTRQCRVCQQPGHKPGDEKCTGKAEPGTILAFSTYQHPLSNHYPAPVKAYGQPTPFKSVEHALFWGMAKDLEKDELAERIRNAAHAGITKSLSKEMEESDRDKWEDDNLNNISEILHEKARTCAPFRRCLIENKEKILAECTSNRKWASGLPKHITEITKPNFFPGRNLLGALLMEIEMSDLQEYEREAMANAQNTDTVDPDAATDQQSDVADSDSEATQTTADPNPKTAAQRKNEKKKAKKAAKAAAAAAAAANTPTQQNQQGSSQTGVPNRDIRNYFDPVTGKRKLQDSTPEKNAKDKVQKTEGSP